MKARLVKESICPCGFPALKVSVPLGTVYEVRTSSILRDAFTFICGGCGKTMSIDGIYVETRSGSHGGYLHLELLELEKEIPDEPEN